MKYIIQEHPVRFLIGIEFEGGVAEDQISQIGTLWEEFMKDIGLLQDLPLERKFIGLECYPPDFMEDQRMDYYAMVQTTTHVERDGFVTKRLPAGKYIQFEIAFDRIHAEMQQVYQYLSKQKIRVHSTFDLEDYWEDQDYGSPGAKLFLSFLLEDE